MSADDDKNGLRLCVDGPFAGQWFAFGSGPPWPIARDHGSVAWYRADPDDDSRALYSGAAPPDATDSAVEMSSALQEEAEAEESERDQDSAT